MLFVKEESEDIKIEEALRVKQEDTEEQTGLTSLKKESQKCSIKEDGDHNSPVLLLLSPVLSGRVTESR
ncbi:hypothetical protein QQF64_035755 [Cirrhinus molitorella]|uniref:Uncharacterized protein n=1 Tax=Cirrhinus molitorella TaxID=172907 RepID=A0ABR3NHB9_9TELE